MNLRDRLTIRLARVLFPWTLLTLLAVQALLVAWLVRASWAAH